MLLSGRVNFPLGRPFEHTILTCRVEFVGQYGIVPLPHQQRSRSEVRGAGAQSTVESDKASEAQSAHRCFAEAVRRSADVLEEVNRLQEVR